MVKLSVLIAVYNAERYLRECLDSVLSQTMTDLQIICVDDASTDCSLAILKDYAARDPRVEVLSLEENGGAARARNRGLRVAKGEYVCFVDSDDWIAPDAAHEICEVFRRDSYTDCVLFDLYYFRDGVVTPYSMTPFDVMTGKEAFAKSLIWEIHGVYAVRTALHKAYPYDTMVRDYGDENTSRIHYLRSRKVRTSGAKYYYRQHSQSVTHTVNVRSFEALRACHEMRLLLRKERLGQEVSRRYENYVWKGLIGYYMLYFRYRGKFSSQERNHVLSLIRQAWTRIDTGLLERKTKRKFGYIPFRWCWPLFRLQEEVYFSLRFLLGK